MKKKVNGNIAGIRQTLLDGLAGIYDLSMGADTFLSQEVLEALTLGTAQINREILVYVSRGGMIEDVRIGDDRTVDLPELRLVRNTDRLCGVRCIHTHPNGSGILSKVDIGSLHTLQLDAMAAVGVVDGRAVDVYAGFIGKQEEDNRGTVLFGPMRPDRLPQKMLLDAINQADALFQATTYRVTAGEPERAVIAGIEGTEGYDSLSELAALCETDGLKVVAREVQKKRSIDSATYLGSGKADELRLTGNGERADLFVFDDELSAVQMRNLEAVLGAPIIDRTMLILDIFAQRAQSREGKLQVELAQLKYRLPRLMGMGKVLSRQGSSGVGMRGPGEKKLEIDRRRIRRRIFELEQELNEIDKQRALRREKRTANAVPVVALVGYTNAGKSTLLNALSGSDALAEDKLFATLDPLVRKITLPGGTECLLSDTVGFINKLPHDLVNAFRSTLEEVQNADLILHVVDASSPYYDVQMRVVEEVLGSLSCLDTPRIQVFNQCDRIHLDRRLDEKSIAISAKCGDGLDALLQLVETTLNEKQNRVELLVPYDRYEAMRILRACGTIVSEEHTEAGTRVCAMLGEDVLWRVRKALGEGNEGESRE
jgi:GTP-binding protein HflX